MWYVTAGHRIAAQHAGGVERQQLAGLGQYELARRRRRRAVAAVRRERAHATRRQRIADRTRGTCAHAYINKHI